MVSVIQAVTWTSLVLCFSSWV